MVHARLVPLILKPILKCAWLPSIFLFGMGFCSIDCIPKLRIWPEMSKLVIDFGGVVLKKAKRSIREQGQELECGDES